MKKALILFVIGTTSLLAQTTRIQDTLRYAGPTGPGPVVNGRLNFSWNAFRNSAGVYKPAGNFNLTVTSGVLDVTLESTTNSQYVGSATVGISYSVRYFLTNGNQRTENWTFAYSATPITMASVTIIATAPPGTASVGVTQLTRSGADDLDCIVFNLSTLSWGPGACATGGTGLTSLNGLVTDPQTFATGSTGTDFGISSAASTHTFNLPNASAANRGLLTSADWTTFNSKAAVGHNHEITGLTSWPVGLDVTELGYLNGVTGALQGQLDGKAALSHAHAAADVTSGTFGDARIAQSNVTQHQAALVLGTSQITAGQLALARGGSAADLSATGGANQIVRQNSLGGVLTVSALVDADIPNTITVDLATVATTANAGDSATAFFSSGTLEGARLPNPAVGTKGGVEALTCAGTNKFSAIGTDGIPVCSADDGGGGGLANAYASMTDGTTTAAAAGGDTFKFRSVDTKLTVAVQSNDVTHGDNLLLTVNEANLTLSGLGGSVTDAQVPDTISLTNLTQIGTRAISDTTGTLAAGRGGLGQTAATEDGVPVGDATAFVVKVLPSCSNATNDKLLYNSTTNAFSCGADQSGAGGGITTLNTLTGATQTFTNDTNVTIVSGGTAHVITWVGTLADARIDAAIARDAEVAAGYVPIAREVNTTSPLTGGGDLSTNKTLACATCVVSSAPGAGLAHFAGGTQTVTSSALVLGDTPLTTRGDLLYANTASPVLARLAKGTQYQTLQGGASDLVWAALPLDQATAVTGLLPSANIDAAIARDAEVAAGYQPLDADLTAHAAVAISTTVGHVLRIGAGPTMGWGAVDLADPDAVANALAKANQHAATVYSDAANTWSTGAQDFSAATSLTAPVAAGAAPIANGTFAYDSTANALEYGDNGVNRTVANLDEAQTFTNKSISGAQITSAVALATALAANPTACTTDQWVTDIAADGTLTCSGIAYAQLTGEPWTVVSTDIYNANAGNVGIGAAPGAFKLDVTGALRVSAAFTMTGQAGLGVSCAHFDNAGVLTAIAGVDCAGGSSGAYSANKTSATTWTVTGATHGLAVADLAVFTKSDDGTSYVPMESNGCLVNKTTFDVTCTFNVAQAGRILILKSGGGGAGGGSGDATSFQTYPIAASTPTSTATFYGWVPGGATYDLFTFGAGLTIASTQVVVDTSIIPSKNAINTFTAGSRQDYTSNATQPPIRLLGVAFSDRTIGNFGFSTAANRPVFADGANLLYVSENAGTTIGDMEICTTTATPCVKGRIAPIGAGAVLMSNGAATAPSFQIISAANVTNALDVTTAVLPNAFYWTGDISPAQLVANTDDWAPTGLATATTIRVSTDASRNLTGLTGGSDGRLILIHNVGAFPLVIIDDATSTAANRFELNANITLQANQSMLFQYDFTTSRWRAVGGIGGGGGADWATLTSGTNTSAAMVVGTGASMTVSGSGTINATSLGGDAAALFAKLASPTFTTPTLGAALATTINGVAFPTCTSCTLDLADSSSIITSGAFAATFTFTATTGVTFPTSGTLSTLAAIAVGTNGIEAYNAGDNTTAARSDHTHRIIQPVRFHFPGTPSSGVQTMTLELPPGITNAVILNLQAVANTVQSGGTTTINVQRCTAGCTGASPTFGNIYATGLDMATNERINNCITDGGCGSLTSTAAASDQFKVNLVSVGTALADVTVDLIVSWENTN